MDVPLEKKLLQVKFSQKGSESLPKLTLENLKNKQLEDGCLAWGHFDIHRIHTNPEPQQGNFRMWILEVISIFFEKTWPVPKKKKKKTFKDDAKGSEWKFE